MAAADVGELTEGLQAEITVSGVTDTVYGTVSEVARVAEVDSDRAAVFPVIVAVTGTRDDLYSGTSADATVIVQQLPDVLTVSTPALQSDGDTTYVEKVVDGVSERVEVETGATYGIATEVVSGLSEGDVVEVPGFTRGTGSGWRHRHRHPAPAARGTSRVDRRPTESSGLERERSRGSAASEPSSS